MEQSSYPRFRHWSTDWHLKKSKAESCIAKSTVCTCWSIEVSDFKAALSLYWLEERAQDKPSYSSGLNGHFIMKNSNNSNTALLHDYF